MFLKIRLPATTRTQFPSEAFVDSGTVNYLPVVGRLAPGTTGRADSARRAHSHSGSPDGDPGT